MGNRSYLYLAHPDTPNEGLEIAEANNHLPSLWRVLLAGGSNAAPITHQRVFDDTGTDNIAVNARAALARYGQLADCLMAHPRIDQLPALSRSLRAVSGYLGSLLDGQVDADALLISANLEEYAWLSDLGPAEFITSLRGELDDEWEQLQMAMGVRDYDAVERLLGIEPYGFEDWAAWCWEFGFGGFGDYCAWFSDCESPPEVEFQEFVQEHDDAEDENDLGLGRVRIKRDGRYGVACRRDDGSVGETLLEPEWEAVDPADDPPRAELWVERGGRVGLVRVAPEEGTRWIIAPELECGWSFCDGLAVVQKDNKMGMVERDGRWFLAPRFDELWDFEHGYALMREGGRHGYLDRTGAVAIAPRFEQGGPFNAHGVAHVTLDGKAGLIRPDGEFAAPAEYESLVWEEGLWQARRGGRRGLLRGDGTALLAAEWNEIARLDAEGRLFKVRRGNAWGLCDRNGRMRLPCVHIALQERLALHNHGLPADGARQFIVRTGEGYGLVDAENNTLIPCRYAAMEDLAENGWDDPHLLVVQEKKRGFTRGVWDLKSGGLRVACVWRHVAPVRLTRGAPPLFVVERPAEKKNGRHLLGVMAADGSMVVPTEFAWFGRPAREACFAIEQANTALRETWSRGEPLLAGRYEGDAQWLHPDGRCEGYVDRLSADYARGDHRAAWQLYKAYRDGDAVVADKALARLWLERAAVSESGAGLPEAMAELAEQLHFRDETPERIRALLEAAVARPEGWATGGARNLLGCYYLDGAGGEARQAEAFALFQVAATQNVRSANYNLGLCHEHGWGTAQDHAQALRCYRKAERLDAAGAAFKIGFLLEESAPEEAAYFYRRALARNETVANACFNLARLINLGLVPRHPDEQFELLKRGAQTGDLDCIFWLLELLEEPDGRWRDPEAAAHWRTRRRELEQLQAN